MSWLDDSWAEMAYAALVETLKVDKHLQKEMIQFLLDEGFWDESKLTWVAAVARFNGCLNRNKAEFFKLGELWALMKRFGRHQFFLAMAEDLGYECRRKPTEERQQELLERANESIERYETELNAFRAELARLNDDSAPRSARAASSRPRPMMSMAERAP